MFCFIKCVFYFLICLKAVHANGAINGFYANSKAVSCGGLLCRPVAGIFTRDPLPVDTYTHVATIPAGASNISITELKNSENLLALRVPELEYVFNGENMVSESASYEVAGATFDYHRIDGVEQGEGVTEWITAIGPITAQLDLLVYTKTANPGIKYEYLLPIISESEENELPLEYSGGVLKEGLLGSSRPGRRRKYNWKVIGFSGCTKSCGGGTQSPILRCGRENPVRYYSQRRCLHLEKPVLNENLLRCNTQPCPAYWRPNEWGPCRCHHGQGFRNRELSCVQELASNIVIHVDRSACLETQPPSQKECECPKNQRHNHLHNRSDFKNVTHSQYNAHKKTRTSAWLMSNWNNYCSAQCGTGVEYRTIFCDRSKLSSERCNQRDAPDIKRPCQTERSCDFGDWFTGPWTPCNGNCFNLTSSRMVICIKNQLITDEEECLPDVKPQSFKMCSHDEVEYCAPRWHYSAWSECSKSCDGGTQRRAVKCLSYDERQNALQESSECQYAVREPIFRNCNTQKCEENKNEQLHNDTSIACIDRFANCQWALQAKLCNHNYYRTNCCYSCTHTLPLTTFK
ncbi:thrombospondin type-1 domain-containing protein 4 [Scaptodrosophila lebanonensis]|uniref:Thrombospondin type-1 domain-containing protein 4 n=1 Tax=Drosophila lebanonensis TaxID=7225 RepID=A0A6J2U6L5_DROLE|nr:thrombospondin type-1 domain-containing protein 4 [Scaptodrosophila lebanonensis]